MAVTGRKSRVQRACVAVVAAVFAALVGALFVASSADATAGRANASTPSVRLPAGANKNLHVVALHSRVSERTHVAAGAGARTAGAGAGPSDSTSSPAYTGVAVVGLGAIAVVLTIGGGLFLLAGRRHHLSV